MVLLVFFLSACTTSGDEKNEMIHQPGALDLIICEEPRPEVCTYEYKPACAMLKDGHTKTYATACASCADKEVVGYTAGGC